MELNFLQKIVLLALDDKGWFGASEHKIRYGLVAAILFELYKLDRITITDDLVVVKNAHSTGNPLLDRVLNVIKTSSKQRSPRSWMQRIVYKKLMLRKTILKQLIQAHIIGREEYSLLVVFYQTKFPLLNQTVKKNLQDEIQEKVISDQPLSDYDTMLLAIMNSCRMVRKNFGGYFQYIKLRGRINSVTLFREPLAESLVIVKTLQTAMNRAIMASNISLHV